MTVEIPITMYQIFGKPVLGTVVIEWLERVDELWDVDFCVVDSSVSWVVLVTVVLNFDVDVGEREKNVNDDTFFLQTVLWFKKVSLSLGFTMLTWLFSKLEFPINDK